MMRILVTGATGGLGRNAVQMLIDKGIEVRATGRNSAIGKQLSEIGAEFISLDLTRATSEQILELVSDVDAVWHCAALSSPWGLLSDFVAANVTVTKTLLAAAGQIGIKRFIYISTPAIYFDYTHRFNIPETFQPKSYVNAYARTKAQAEQLVQEAVTRFSSMQCVILRPRAIFGPHDNVLIPRLARVLKEGHGKIPLPKGGLIMIDITYVDNVVHAMWLASTNGNIPSGTAFNITNHEPTLLCEVLQKLFKDSLKQPFRILALPYPLLAGVARCMQLRAYFSGKEPALTPYSLGAISYNMTLDNMKARQYLGYVPPVNLAEGIRRTAAWMKLHG